MKLFYCSTIIILLFASCKAYYLAQPPIPIDTVDISTEMKYIEKTDQTDRKKGWFHIIMNDKKGAQIIARDSIRAIRVQYIYDQGLIILDDDKFTVGLIFMHSPLEKHGKLAYTVFKDLELTGSTESARMNGQYWSALVIQQGIYAP